MAHFSSFSNKTQKSIARLSLSELERISIHSSYKKIEGNV
jgi:hypothetical protein